MSNFANKIEALLFALGRPLSRTELVKMLGASAEEIELAIAELREKKSGIVLVDDKKNLELRAAPEAEELIARARKEEYSRDIGRAGLEALAALFYKGLLTRAEIDFMRGVNASQTLRTLTMRGLVRKIPNPKDERSFLYEPTTELLATLGIARMSDLPQYKEVRQKLDALEKQYNQPEQAEEKENA